MSAHALLIPELDEVIERGSPERRAKTLRRITTLFLDGAGQFNDDHLGLFDLVFNRLIAGAEVKLRTELSHRLAPLGTVPAEVVRRLAHDDDIAVAGPVLARSRQLADADLVTIARTQDQAHLLAIAGRGRIAEAVTDVLVRRGDREVAHRLADNPGARLSERGFFTLVERAKTESVLAEKVALRTDIPARLFRDLLLAANPLVQQRLLASATPEMQAEIRRLLANILQPPPRATSAPPDYATAQRTIEALRQGGAFDETAVVEFANKGQYAETVSAMASLCTVPTAVVDRLMRAERPDPVVILCKAAGWSWATVVALLAARPGGLDTSTSALEAVHADFDRVSPGTAKRVARFWQMSSDDAQTRAEDGAEV
jgi:uncharacterized protein (DUF2336 family)